MKQVNIVGAGLMGTDIATAFLVAGYDVLLIDLQPEAVQRAAERIHTRLENKPTKGKLTTTPLTEFHHQDGAVIESITESIDAKQSVLSTLSSSVARSTPIFSNTSTLSIETLSKAITHPERFAGLHFFYPAHKNPFVEIIKTAATDHSTIYAAEQIASQLGKNHIVCIDRPGFIINAFYLPLVNEAAKLADEKLASPSNIDNLAKSIFNMPVGPLAVARFMNPHTTSSTIISLVEQHACPPIAPSLANHTLTQLEDDTSTLSDEAVSKVQDRLRASVFIPCLNIIASGKVEPETIDKAALHALQFGDPPFALMHQMGHKKVKDIVCPALSAWERPESDITHQLNSFFNSTE